MKKKGIKKIQLSKETLRHLENDTLGTVAGAATENPTRCNPFSGCPSCETCPIRACGSDTCPPCAP
jgi:hypothetical protein